MVKIREITSGDYYDIRWLFLESWKGWLNKENKTFDIPYDNRRTADCLEYVIKRTKHEEGFVAEEDGKIVGYILYSKSWNNLHIDDLYVRAD